MNRFIKYPFVRLLIPLVLGLFCGDYLFTQHINLPYLKESLVASLVMLLLTAFLKRYSCRHIFGGLLYLSFFLGALYMVHEELSDVQQNFPNHPALYRVRLLEEAQEKRKTIMFPARVVCRYDSLGQCMQQEGKVYLYFLKDTTTLSYNRGDELLVSTQLEMPPYRNNFDEFDYSSYLLHHGVSGQGFIYHGGSQLLKHHFSNDYSFRSKAELCRSQIEQRINHLDLKPLYKSIILALTIGEREGLSKELYQQFSIAGVSHVLALSGFHIALLAALLTFVLHKFPIKYKGKKYFDALIIVAFLFFYCSITGYAPSVVRSVVMYCLLSLSYLLQRDSFSVNSLAVSAFFMLLINPLWVFDVGFQLSFTAVFFILLFQPPLYRCFNRLKYSHKYISGILSVSIAAQVGTFPLILYYFSQLSTHFLLSNLLVIPVVAIVVYLCYLLLFSLFVVSGLVPYISLFIQGALLVLISVVEWINALPFASFSSIWFDCYDLFFCYLLLLLAARYYYSYYKLHHLYHLLIVLFIAVSYHSLFYIEHEAAPGIRFYNVKGSTVVHCITTSESSYLVCSHNKTPIQPVREALSHYFMHYHIAPPTLIKQDYKDDELVYHSPIIFFRGRSIMMVGANNWHSFAPPASSACPMAIDYLYLYSGFKGNISDLSNKFSVGRVIVDSSLSKYYRSKIEAWCKKYKKPFISLVTKGSVEFLF